MLHRKLVEPALARLDGESATYFTQLSDHLAEDPRVEDVANLVFLLLKESMPYLPTYLPYRELSDRLLGFADANRVALNRAIFDRGFIVDSDGPKAFRKLANVFVHGVVAEIMKRYDEGDVDGGQRAAFRFSWPYDTDDFPYAEED